MGKLKQELLFFKTQSHQMRTLLKTNMVYAFVIPVIELFVGAYIIRNAGDFSLVMIYQLAQGTGTVITFIINGYLSRRIPIARIYAAGMILSGLSMVVMMLLGELTIIGIAATGLSMGFAYGFFWANRVSLALISTTNENRNYYYGLEALFFTTGSIAMPMLGGFLIGSTKELGWFEGSPNMAYYILTGLIILLTFIAGYLITRGKFQQPTPSRFIYFSFHRLWKKMLVMAALKGVAQGFIIAAPVMLVMRLVGNEATIGSIQSIGSGLSAVMLYMLGRAAAPKHRLKIFTAGLTLFLLGTIINTSLFNPFGVIIFVGCLVFARPLLDLAYFPIQLGVIDCVAKREGRSQFTYLFSHEVGLYIGKIFGCLFFVFTARDFGGDWALRYSLLLVAAIQLTSTFVAKSITTDPAWCEASRDIPLAPEALKEPAELG